MDTMVLNPRVQEEDLEARQARLLAATAVLNAPIAEADAAAWRAGVLAAIAYRRWQRAAAAAQKPADNPALGSFLFGLAELMEQPIE
jgi:hypothetical protein